MTEPPWINAPLRNLDNSIQPVKPLEMPYKRVCSKKLG